MIGRKRGSKYPVYCYDPKTKKKVYVGSRESMKDARQLEREEMAKIAARKEVLRTKCDEFAATWTEAYPRSEQTNLLNKERVKQFSEDFKGRTLDSVTRAEARAWALKHKSRLPAVRAMFTDAVEDGLCRENPFVKLGIERSTETRRRVPLTEDQLLALADKALDVHGDVWGPTFRAMVLFAAYTGIREGEQFALRWRHIEGDVLNVEAAFNSKLAKETAPKHNSVGRIFIPPAARNALATIPQGFGDDLVFTTKRDGVRFRQSSLHFYWTPVRVAFGMPDLKWHGLRHFCGSYMLNVLKLEPWVIAQQLRHDDGGRLVVELYGHPSRDVARDTIRDAFAGATRAQLREISGAAREHKEAESA